MPRKKKSEYDWWKDRFETITKYGEISAEQIYKKLVQSTEFTPYKKGPWTLMKLSILAYYIDIYTNIAKMHFNGDICYIDTMSGPGIIYDEKETGIYAFGSPVLSLIVPKQNKAFDKYIFIDRSRQNIKSLNLVVSALGLLNRENEQNKKIIYKCADMNRVDYNQLTKGCAHSLVFIDPEGLEVEFNTLKRIAKMNSDILINFMESGVKRTVGKKDEDRLNRFFGTDKWKNISNHNSQEFLNLYIEQVKPLRKYTNSIKVKSSKSFYYYIVIMLKTSRKFVRAFDSLRNRVEQTDYSTLLSYLRTYSGKNKNEILDPYM